MNLASKVLQNRPPGAVIKVALPYHYTIIQFVRLYHQNITETHTRDGLTFVFPPGSKQSSYSTQNEETWRTIIKPAAHSEERDRDDRRMLHFICRMQQNNARTESSPPLCPPAAVMHCAGTYIIHFHISSAPRTSHTADIEFETRTPDI